MHSADIQAGAPETLEELCDAPGKLMMALTNSAVAAAARRGGGAGPGAQQQGGSKRPRPG